MKSKFNCKYFFRMLVPVLSLMSLFCFVSIVHGQEKKATTIGLSFYKKSDRSKTAVADVKAKNNENKFAPAKNIKVNFYVENNKQEQFINSSFTDNGGKAAIELPKDLPLDTGRCFTIIAKIENDILCEDVDEQVRYKEANLSLKLNQGDTSRTVLATVTEIGKDGKEIPVKDAEVKFYVNRLFGFMPAGEENTVTTNENGEASFMYPKNIPGDTLGEITMTARIEDNERFGNVESKTSASWGVVLMKDENPFPRALWAPNAPIPVLLTLCILFGGVWSTYFLIFYMLHKIKKAGNV